MTRRLHPALRSVLALILGAGALVLGTAGTASADLAGTVTLTPGSGNVTDDHPFGQVSVSAPCPDHYQDSLSLFLTLPGEAGGDTGIAYGLTDGAPFSGTTISTQVPVKGDGPPTVYTIADAFSNIGAVVADGTYPLKVVCNATDTGTYPETPTFSTLIDISGDTWSANRAAPAKSTAITLASDPAGHAVVSKEFSLKATVTPPDAAGSVQFYLNGTSAPGALVKVSDGTAEAPVQPVAAPGPHDFSAAFIPDDPTKFTASASPLLTLPIVSEPGLTANDDSGNTLGSTPTLKAGQKIALTVQGFLPATTAGGSGEKVTVTLDGTAGSLAKAATDDVGTVTKYAFTVPSDVADGDHTLKFHGDTSAIEQSFAFTVGADSANAGTTQGSTAGDTAGTDAGTGDDAGADAGSTAGGTPGSTAGDTSVGTSGGTPGGTSGGGNGPLAATGADGIVPMSLLAFLLLTAGSYVVHRVRRDGKLLSFGPSPRD